MAAVVPASGNIETAPPPANNLDMTLPEVSYPLQLKNMTIGESADVSSIFHQNTRSRLTMHPRTSFPQDGQKLMRHLSTPTV